MYIEMKPLLQEDQEKTSFQVVHKILLGGIGPSLHCTQLNEANQRD
jgi:hypothetical protein